MNVLQDIEKQALHLEQSDRAMLAAHLIASLDTGEGVDAENFWIKEAESRYIAYQQGEVSSISATEALAKARKNLK